MSPRAERRQQFRLHEDHVAILHDLIKRGLAAAEADERVDGLETLELWAAVDDFETATGRAEPLAPVINLAMERRRRRGTTHPAGGIA